MSESTTLRIHCRNFQFRRLDKKKQGEFECKVSNSYNSILVLTVVNQSLIHIISMKLLDSLQQTQKCLTTKVFNDFFSIRMFFKVYSNIIGQHRNVSTILYSSLPLPLAQNRLSTRFYLPIITMCSHLYAFCGKS